MRTSDHVNEYHAEISRERYITDCGPVCAECDSGHGGGLYMYLAPVTLVDGMAEVHAQCAVCHYVRAFVMEWTGAERASDIRRAHESVTGSCDGRHKGPLPMATRPRLFIMEPRTGNVLRAATADEIRNPGELCLCVIKTDEHGNEIAEPL